MPSKFIVLSYKAANKNMIRVFQNGSFPFISAVIDAVYPDGISQTIKVALITRAGMLWNINLFI
jgi:hypothetical protein